MERFYSNHITKRMDAPSALQEAEHWVRGLTATEVAEYVNECKNSANSDELKKLDEDSAWYLKNKETNAIPFAHPYYWAGFTVNGA
jgi:CHAT domain-containing protein